MNVTTDSELAEHLRAGAAAGIPDPVFVDGLRAELLLRAAEREARLQDEVRYAVVETSVGLLAVAYRHAKVVGCTALPADAGLQEAAELEFQRSVAGALEIWPQRDASPPAKLARAVRDHVAGRRRFRDVDLSWLTPFQQRVLAKTSEIPRGEVRPYAWIAREIGAPGAVRAVGTALGHNPIPFLVPCHRVVRSDWSLGEYSGGGPAVKQRVLDFEGARIAALAQGPRYNGCLTTHIVCYPTCHAARRVRPEYQLPFASLAAAEASGYRPCKLCRPA